MSDEIIQETEDLKFSIIIPAYNNAATIVASLESCFKQSYTNYEILVINDASTDNTEEVLKLYMDRISYHKFSSNKGPSAARNMGMDVATGDFFAFLDADDQWHPDKLHLANTILKAAKNIEFLYHPFTTDVILHKRLPEDITIYRLPLIKLLPGNVIGTPCVIMKKSLRMRFEPKLRYMEDYDLWLRTAYKHKLFFIKIPLTQIGRPVLSPGGQSSNRWKMRRAEMRVYRRLLKLNIFFIFLLPFLWLSSIGKHLAKMVTKQ